MILQANWTCRMVGVVPTLIRVELSAHLLPALSAARPLSGAAFGPLTGRTAVVVDLTGSPRGLPAALALAGCAVRSVTHVVEARRLLSPLGPDAVVVLDALHLPAAVATSLPALSRHAAVVVCTPRAGASQRIALLGQGADAVVAGTDVQEVVAVLEALVRRAAPVAPHINLLSVGDLHVELATRVASVGERTLRLTALEFDLLAYFAARPGRPLSRERLLRDVWGYDVGGLDTVTVHVRRLRMKIEQDASRPRLLETVWGVGYRLSEPALVPVATVEATAG